METICKTPAEAAKRIRTELKAAFPGSKFSVRTSHFSMGNSIDVSWIDGPTNRAVDAIIKKYEYGRFDGMTDTSSVEDTLVSMPNGDIATLGGAKFVQSNRTFSIGIEARAQRDVCALGHVEFQSRNTMVLANTTDRHWSAESVAYRMLYRSDLTKGYNGLRLISDLSLSFDESIQVIPEGETIHPAPVAYVPPAEDVIAPAVLEVHVAAALEIIAHVGTPIRTMRAEARRATVAHRCYVRYPSLDRELVMRAVLTVLVVEMTKEQDDWDGGQSIYQRNIEDAIAADPDQP